MLHFIGHQGNTDSKHHDTHHVPFKMVSTETHAHTPPGLAGDCVIGSAWVASKPTCQNPQTRLDRKRSAEPFWRHFLTKLNTLSDGAAISLVFTPEE